MMQGMAFGAGSEVAHQGIRSMMGGSGHQETVDQSQTNSQAQPMQQGAMCQLENNNFVDCLKYNNNQISSCQSFFDSLKMCEENMKN